MVEPEFMSNKLLWLDMEMTGLDPAVDRILEVAAIVTDFNFNELARYESVINQSPEVMKNMNEWARENHTANGLVDRVKTAPNEKHVVADFVDFIKSNFNEPVILAGNSIHTDRIFIRKWWPEVEQFLHYRMVDVSSFKIIMENKYAVVFEKHKVHRAFDDIINSINELKYYLKHINDKP
jgi:oligoribonuclease